MTISLNNPCDMCKNNIGKVNGWDIGCKAFPDGIPNKIYFGDARSLKECANGYKWEYDESKDLLRRTK